MNKAFEEKPADKLEAKEQNPDAAAQGNEIVFTPAAAVKVKSILESLAEEESDSTARKDILTQCLRIAITGGGCSGFKYDFSFTDHNEDDYAVMQEDVTLVVDPISFAYLEGATVDYESNAEGEQFVIRNPKASSQCGCGKSFSM